MRWINGRWEGKWPMAVGGVELVKRLAHRWHHGRGREKGRKEGSAHPTLSTPASLKPTRASHRQSAGTASAKRTSPLSLPAFRIIGSTVVAAAVVVGFFLVLLLLLLLYDETRPKRNPFFGGKLGNAGPENSPDSLRICLYFVCFFFCCIQSAFISEKQPEIGRLAHRIDLNQFACSFRR